MGGPPCPLQLPPESQWEPATAVAACVRDDGSMAGRHSASGMELWQHRAVGQGIAMGRQEMRGTGVEDNQTSENSYMNHDYDGCGYRRGDGGGAMYLRLL